MGDYVAIEKFVNVIREIVLDVLEKNDLRFEQCYNGIVTNVESGDDIEYEIITVLVNDVTLSDLKNKTGEKLSIGDSVRVYTTSSTLTDAYVGVKL